MNWHKLVTYIGAANAAIFLLAWLLVFAVLLFGAIPPADAGIGHSTPKVDDMKNFKGWPAAFGIVALLGAGVWALMALSDVKSCPNCGSRKTQHTMAPTYRRCMKCGKVWRI